MADQLIGFWPLYGSALDPVVPRTSPTRTVHTAVARAVVFIPGSGSADGVATAGAVSLCTGRIPAGAHGLADHPARATLFVCRDGVDPMDWAETKFGTAMWNSTAGMTLPAHPRVRYLLLPRPRSPGRRCLRLDLALLHGNSARVPFSSRRPTSGSAPGEQIFRL